MKQDICRATFSIDPEEEETFASVDQLMEGGLNGIQADAFAFVALLKTGAFHTDFQSICSNDNHSADLMMVLYKTIPYVRQLLVAAIQEVEKRESEMGDTMEHKAILEWLDQVADSYEIPKPS
jgi:hypothetical protein